MKDKIRKNELIAKFMGGIYSIHAEAWGLGSNVHVHPKPIKRGNKTYKNLVWAERFEKNLKYHCSWSWLMPVVEKIEAMFEQDIIINGCACYINIQGIEISYTETTKIAAVYNAVVDFIIEYNNLKTKQ